MVDFSSINSACYQTEKSQAMHLSFILGDRLSKNRSNFHNSFFFLKMIQEHISYSMQQTELKLTQ